MSPPPPGSSFHRSIPMPPPLELHSQHLHLPLTRRPSLPSPDVRVGGKQAASQRPQRSSEVPVKPSTAWCRLQLGLRTPGFLSQPCHSGEGRGTGHLAFPLWALIFPGSWVSEVPSSWDTAGCQPRRSSQAFPLTPETRRAEKVPFPLPSLPTNSGGALELRVTAACDFPKWSLV